MRIRDFDWLLDGLGPPSGLVFALWGLGLGSFEIVAGGLIMAFVLTMNVLPRIERVQTDGTWKPVFASRRLNEASTFVGTVGGAIGIFVVALKSGLAPHLAAAISIGAALLWLLLVLGLSRHWPHRLRRP